MRKAVVSVLVAAAIAGAGLLVVGKVFDDGSAARSPQARAVAPPRKPPVVFIQLDEFPIDTLLRPDGRIDSARFPNFAALARTATWYRNAWSVYDSTTKATPAIMDAKLPRPYVPATAKGHPASVFTLFGRRGYRLVSTEEATAVCPRRYCPNARASRPGILHNLNRERPERFERTIRAIRPGRPTLYFHHVLLPHVPWIYLPSGKQLRPTVKDLVPGMGGPRGFHDRGLTRHNEQRYVLQLAFVDTEVGKLLTHLRRVGLLDQTMIMITADHGLAFKVGVPDRRRVTESNVDEIAPVPLFIKAPGQRRGRVDNAYVRTVDILPTVAGILNFRLPWPHQGRPAYSRSVRRRRTLRLFTRDFDRIVKIGARALERRRRRNIRRRAQIFGTGTVSRLVFGSPFATLYRIGPHRELLGRPLAELTTTGLGRVRAHVVGAQLRRSVDLSSSLLPIQVAGRIIGGRRGAKRDIAVAVNGRVEALGRTFYLKGEPSESFSVLVPDTSLRQGFNDVRVFEVLRRGGSLVLTPLARDQP